MKERLKSKVAVITGASRGIGLAIARRLKSEGAIVYEISRHFEPNVEMKKAYVSNVNDNDNIKAILEQIYKDEGRIDIFVNNAGYGIAGGVEYSSKESIYGLVETNLSAVINLSRLAIPYLKETKGYLVNISSVGGVIPLPYQAVYSATKSGVEVFSRAIANEVKSAGIKVCAVMPGDTNTNFTKARTVENSLASQDEREKIARSIKKAEQEEQTGMNPDRVGKAVLKVVTRKNPPLRKTVGGKFKLIVFLTRLVPTRLLNWLVKKIYI